MRGKMGRSSLKKILRTFSNKIEMRNRCIGPDNGDRNIINNSSRKENRLNRLNKVLRGQSNPEKKNKLSTNQVQEKALSSGRVRNSPSMTGKSMMTFWRTDTLRLRNSRMITHIFTKVNSISPNRSRRKEDRRATRTARDHMIQVASGLMPTMNEIVQPIRIKALLLIAVKVKITTTSSSSTIHDF